MFRKRGFRKIQMLLVIVGAGVLLNVCIYSGFYFPETTDCFGSNLTVTHSYSTALPDKLDEISGAVFGRTNPDVVWIHNDSSAEATLYAVNLNGDILAEVRLTDVTPVDWEDIAIAPNSSGGWDIFIADIGDNSKRRESIQIYRLVEPDLSGLEIGTQIDISDYETYNFQYPDKPQNSEALIIDANAGELYIFTKKVKDTPGQSRLFSSTVDLADQSTTVLDFVSEVSFADFPSKNKYIFSITNPISKHDYVTAADLMMDGGFIGVRTYSGVFVWNHDSNKQGIFATLSQFACEIPTKLERQGEAFAFSVSGDRYITISETYPFANPEINIYTLSQ